MISIGLACIYAFFLWLSRVEGPRIFQRAANFLFWWYIVILFLASVLLFFVLTGYFTLAFSSGTFLFSDLILGTFMGGVISIFISVLFGLFMLAEIIGAHLLRTSVEKRGDIWVWNNGRVIIGFLLIIISPMLTFCL